MQKEVELFIPFSPTPATLDAIFAEHEVDGWVGIRADIHDTDRYVDATVTQYRAYGKAPAQKHDGYTVRVRFHKADEPREIPLAETRENDALVNSAMGRLRR